MTNIGHPATDTEFQQLTLEVDGSGVGTIEFSIFISIMPLVILASRMKDQQANMLR